MSRADNVFPHTIESYLDEVKADAIFAIEDGEYDYADDFDEAYEDMWVDDSITGNGSGSYYFNARAARQAVIDMVFDSDAREWVDGNYGKGNFDRAFADGEEALDVTFRCLALSEVAEELREAFDARKSEED